MAYTKQTWKQYDDNKTEEQNIQDGAVVTSDRMNHIEEGLETHSTDKTNPHEVTKTQVGLDKVDNIQQAPKSEFDTHVANNNNPHSVTKSQVGLGNVDNVQQAPLTDFTTHKNDKSNPHSVTKTQVGLGNVDNYLTATQADAESGYSLIKFMTPLRVFQAIAKWTSGKFVELTGNQTVAGTKNFQDGLLVNGKQVLTTDYVSGESLWKGASSLGALDIIPSKTLDTCQFGWLLRFGERNTSGGTYSNGSCYYVIPKSHTTISGDGASVMCPIIKLDGSYAGAKQIFVSNNKLRGTADNTGGTMYSYLLTEILAI